MAFYLVLRHAQVREYVRALTIDSEPWFVVRDVAAIPDSRMASDMTRMLDMDEVDTQIVRTRFGDQPVTIISDLSLWVAPVFQGSWLG